MGEAFEDKVRRFFPYPSFRPFQMEAIRFSFNVIRDGGTGLLSSPCGTGKSISVLTAYFMAREANRSVGRLLALTRTRNQLEIYCRELKRIKEHSDVNFTASFFKSKMDMCPKIRDKPEPRVMSYTDFLRYCGEMKRTCEHYQRTYRRWRPSWRTRRVIEEIRMVGPLLPDEVYEACRGEALCPYEVTKVLARYADIIVGNYNYLLLEPVRRSLLGRARIKMRELNCILDEAHSLPSYASGLLSDELSSTSLERALRETKEYSVEDFNLLSFLHDIVVDIGESVYENYGLDVEHDVQSGDVMKPLMKSLDADVERLYDIVSELEERAEEIRRRRFESGRRPISYLSRCLTFLREWMSLTDPSYALYVKAVTGRDGRRRSRLGVRCLDPSLATGVINKLRSAILMSGTLWHTDYYVDVLGIDRSRCDSVKLPSPFPPERRLIIVDKSVTTRFERRGEEEYRRMAEHLRSAIEKIGGSVAVYFPSYEVMREVLSFLKLETPAIVEERRTKIVDVLRFLNFLERCVVFGVARGKISEGVDMSSGGRSMLSAVVIVGLPYPKMTELHSALTEYFKEKFKDKAFDYANEIPCLNALAQSAGRLLRSPEDRGVILIMDGRAALQFKQRLPEDWRREMKAHLKIDKILKRIENFYTMSRQKESES